METMGILRVSSLAFSILAFCASVLCVSSLTHAQDAESSPQAAFAKGNEAYKQQKWDAAAQAFQQALDIEPDNPAFLYNLGLTRFQEGKVGHAIALWRRAQYLAPDFAPPSVAIAVAQKLHPIREIPHEILLWENLRQKLLVPLGITPLLSTLAILFLVTGWLAIIYLGRRRVAEMAGEAMPPAPLAAITCATLLSLVAMVTGLKGIDYLIPRGTITAPQVTVHTAPSEDATELFDLYGGIEVIIRQKHAGWVQITYPGSYTGWIQTNALLHTAGKSPW